MWWASRQMPTDRSVSSSSSASMVPPPLPSNKSNTSRKAATEIMHYSDVIMASQITGISIVPLTLFTLCEGNPPVTGGFPSKGSVTRKMVPFHDAIMDDEYHDNNDNDYSNNNENNHYLRDDIMVSAVCLLNFYMMIVINTDNTGECLSLHGGTLSYIRRPADVIMIVADALAPNRRRATSNRTDDLIATIHITKYWYH